MKMQMQMQLQKGWIGVDLDGTLAEYHGEFNTYKIGDPIPLMLSRVKGWLEEGKDVRIFTARVDGVPHVESFSDPIAVAYYQDVPKVISVIQDWCEKHIGKRLPVTNKKDFHMIELWDDRCVQVELNTGVLMTDKARGV
jgi:hypothetical protein